jgi:3-deoxy-7-phosphoheptulonate synthase
VRFGGSQPVLIGGPCAVESRAQLLGAARAVRDAGGAFLRGGAFKPRTSPYTFQGLGEEGLKILSDVREETGVPVVTEMTSVRQLPLFDRYAVDLVQVGARSMYNYDLLQELGRRGRPVLLKRAFSATLEELLLAAEYLVTSGSDRVVLCERGIRAFEPAYRFTLDLNAVAYLREKTHLPVIVDPSHGTGSRSMVERMSFAAIAAGAQGLLVEVHPNPARARSDAGQQLAPDEFRALAERVRGLWTYLRSPGAFSPV